MQIFRSFDLQQHIPILHEFIMSKEHKIIIAIQICLPERQTQKLFLIVPTLQIKANRKTEILLNV